MCNRFIPRACAKKGKEAISLRTCPSMMNCWRKLMVDGKEIFSQKFETRNFKKDLVIAMSQGYHILVVSFLTIIYCIY